MIIAVASGKGGTGKTTVAVNLAAVAERVQYIDCDVEAPNGHIFLKPQVELTETATSSVPEIDTNKCTGCGVCARICAYHALAVMPAASGENIPPVVVFSHLCHGCGACWRLCPQQAIRRTEKPIGEISRGSFRQIDFVQAELKLTELLSASLIRQVRARQRSDIPVIIDAPPGTSCPVVAAVRQTDYCVLVTEPTPFGLHDLRLAVDVVRKLRVRCGVVINRAGNGESDTAAYCREHAIPVLAEIPFRREIAGCYAGGGLLVDSFPEYAALFEQLWRAILREAQ